MIVEVIVAVYAALAVGGGRHARCADWIAGLAAIFQGGVLVMSRRIYALAFAIAKVDFQTFGRVASFTLVVVRAAAS